jgi:hypothetical protein
VLVLHLLCPCIVLRAILNKKWLDENNRITSTAFLYDPVKHPDGLSVNISVQTDIEGWLGGFNNSYGADSLHCGRIRGLELDVGQTQKDLENDISHAVIVGLPSPDEDPKRAEDLASQLVEMSRSLERNRRRRA